MPPVVPGREVRYLGPLGRPVPARARPLVCQEHVCAGRPYIRLSRQALRPSLEVRFQGHGQRLEGRALGPGEAHPALQAGGGQVLRRLGQPLRQLRLFRLEVSAVELGKYRPQAGHRRHLGQDCAGQRPAVRRVDPFQPDLGLARRGPRQRQDRPAGGRSLRRRSDQGRRQGAMVGGLRSGRPLRPRRRGPDRRGQGRPRHQFLQPHQGPGRTSTIPTCCISTAPRCLGARPG